MKKVILKIFLTTIILFTTIASYGQRYYDSPDSEEYDWNEFNFSEILIGTLIYGVIIIIGLLVKKSSSNSFVKAIGAIIIVIGSLGVFASLGGPIAGVISIIVRVAVIAGIIYLVYNEINKN